MRTIVEQFGQDLRYALRMFRQSPAFTALAALSLALGIGANTAIYSFMDAILVRSMPVAKPESLVVVQFHTREFPAVARGFSGSNFKDAKRGLVSGNIPYPTYEALRENNQALASMFGFSGAGNLTMLVGGDGAAASAEYVTGEFFPCMGVPPAAGRVFGESDDQPGAPAVAVASYAYAERRFGDVQKAPGQTVLLNNVPYTIAGVAARGFAGMYPGRSIDLYLPMHSNTVLEGPRASGQFTGKQRFWVQVIGRLRPGVTMAQAQAAMQPVFQNYFNSVASNDKERADLPQFYLQEAAGGMDFLRRRYEKPLYVLMTMVGLILAIACANIANLLLARATGRRREMAVRLSLGAGRGRVIRQLLTESVLLSLMGAVLGIAAGTWGIRILSVLIANGNQSFVLEAGLNWRVLGLTVAVAMVAGVLFGLAPALQSSSVDLTPALKQTRGGEPAAYLRRGWRRIGLSRVLVVSQIAISLLLLVAAGLFVRTLNNINSITAGFNQERVLLFSVNAWQANHHDAELSRFYGTLQSRLSAVPGVKAASLSDIILLSGSASSDAVRLPGSAAPSSRDGNIYFLTVGPSYFDTMQIPVLLGRDFAAKELDTNKVLVNDLLAKQLFGTDNPIGRHILRGAGANPDDDLEIIGVVKNVRYQSLKRDIPPTVYRACCKNVRGMTFAVRAAGDPLALAGTVRELVRQADSRIPVTNLTTQERITAQGVGQERTFATLCTGFALLAVVIACVGLYGTMAYTVARRTGEIGIRMALGAESGRVVWMVLREVMILAALGLAIGVPIAYGSAKVIETFLFGLKARDTLTMVAAPLALLLAAIFAGYGPARRASRIDPMTALRQD